MSPLQNDRYWVAGQNHRDIRQRRVQIMDGHDGTARFQMNRILLNS